MWTKTWSLCVKWVPREWQTGSGVEGGRKVSTFLAFFSILDTGFLIHTIAISLSPNLKTWSLANFCIPAWKLFHVFLIFPRSSTQQLKPLENVTMFETTQPATQSTKVARSAEFGNIHNYKQTALYLCVRESCPPVSTVWFSVSAMFILSLCFFLLRQDLDMM